MLTLHKSCGPANARPAATHIHCAACTTLIPITQYTKLNAAYLTAQTPHNDFYNPPCPQCGIRGSLQGYIEHNYAMQLHPTNTACVNFKTSYSF